MQWLGFIIIGLVGLILQVTVAPRLGISGVSPDLVLILAVFFALHVKGREAIAAGWALGLMADLHSVERFGVMSIAYGLIAVGVYLVRDLLFRRHYLTHFFLTFVSALVLQLLFLLYYTKGLQAEASLSQGRVTIVLAGALYSACWAVPVHMLLLRLSPSLRLEVPKYSHAGLSRAGR